jgi:hypothetical protein
VGWEPVFLGRVLHNKLPLPVSPPVDPGFILITGLPAQSFRRVPSFLPLSSRDLTPVAGAETEELAESIAPRSLAKVLCEESGCWASRSLFILDRVTVSESGRRFTSDSHGSLIQKKTDLGPLVERK